MGNFRTSRTLSLCMIAVALAVPLRAASAPDAIGEAFDDLYNFDFPAAHAVLNQYIAAHPRKPLPYAVRSAAYLFYELDRLGILEGQFFTDDARIADKKKLKPDPEIRKKFLDAVADAQSRARVDLARAPDDQSALFAMCITLGLTSDYAALVDKHQLASLGPARQSTRYAQRLLQLDPHFYDAYLTTGINQYLLGSLPFFIRWFVHFDNLDGDKDQGIEKLKLVARSGHYLRPFAKILLGICYLRDKKPLKARNLLEELAREYPRNPLYPRELAKIESGTAGSAN